MLNSRLNVVILAVIVGFAIFLNVVASVPTAKPLTAHQQCDPLMRVNAQTQSQRYMDLQQQPCDDFWEYACGDWRASAVLRFAQPSDTLTAIKASNKYTLLQYFDDVQYKNVKVNNSLINLTTFYRSCLDRRAFKSKAQDEQSIRVYMNILQNFTSSLSLPQVNLSSHQVNKTFNWESTAAEMRRYGAHALITTKIQSNWQNSQQLIFYMMPTSFELLKRRPSDTTIDEAAELMYRSYIKELMLDLGVRVRQAKKIADEIVEFEKSLMSLVQNDQSVVLKEPQTLASLAKDIPEIDLSEYFRTLLQDFELPDNYDDAILIVADHNYLRSLAKFLKKANNETLAKYFLVQFLAHFEVNLNDDYSFIRQKEECLLQLNDFMPSELSYLFLQLKHGNAEEYLDMTQQHLTKIFNNLKLQFEKLLNTTTVFERDLATKILTKEKLKAMRLLLPTLEFISLEDMSFTIGDNYDVNVINLSKLQTFEQLKKTIPHMVNDVNGSILDTKLPLYSLYIDQSYGPLDVNAFYRLKKNAIEIPIGILQEPLYDPCLKPAIIYGGLAYIIAHELIHGFDYDGLNYDKSGNVANAWGVKSIIKFGVKSNCYLNERYNNGHMAINENIADSEGLRLSLETFLETEMDEAFDQEDLKLFFTSFAQVWCGDSSAKHDKISLSLHGSHKDRVNNVLGNFMEFADVYKCKPGTTMHPEEKCRIW